MKTRLFVITVVTILSVVLSACSNAQVNSVVTAVEQTVTMPTGHWYIGKINPNCTINFRVTRVNDADTLLIEQYIGNSNEPRITPVNIGGQFMASCALTTLQVDTVIEGNLTKVTRLYNPIEGIEYELLEKGGDPVVVPEGKNLGTIEYIPIDQEINLVLPNEDPAEFGELYQIEAEIYAYWEQRTTAEPLKKNEFERLLADGISVGVAQVSVINGEINIYVDPMYANADVLIPAITYTPTQIQYILTGIQEFATKGSGYWFKTFHYAMEQTKLGGNPYDLWGATTLMFRVFKSAVESNSLYSLGSKVMAIAKVGNHNLAILLDQSGAAVTTILTDYRHGKFNNGEAERYLNAKIAQGWTQINRDQLPAGIQKFWRDAAKPPVIRVAAWAILYQAKMAAIYLKIAVTASLSQLLAFYGSSYTDFIILAMPPCTDAITSICPFAEAPGT